MQQLPLLPCEEEQLYWELDSGARDLGSVSETQLIKLMRWAIKNRWRFVPAYSHYAPQGCIELRNRDVPLVEPHDYLRILSAEMWLRGSEWTRDKYPPGTVVEIPPQPSWLGEKFSRLKNFLKNFFR